jgi:hypothetical protein
MIAFLLIQDQTLKESEGSMLGFRCFFHSIMQEQCTHAPLCTGSMSSGARLTQRWECGWFAQPTMSTMRLHTLSYMQHQEKRELQYCAT